MTERQENPLNENVSWRRVSRRILLKHPRLTVIEDEIELPSGDRASYLLFGSGDESVTIICVRNNEVLLQREYSYPPNEVLFQFPGGKVESSESFKDAATRELAEESQLEPEKIKVLGWYYVNNRRSDAKMYVVTASGFKKNQTLDGDSEEHIASLWLPIAEFEKMIRDGKIVNYSVLAAWALYKAAEKE